MLTIREKLTYLTYLNTHSSRQDEPFQSNKDDYLHYQSSWQWKSNFTVDGLDLCNFTYSAAFVCYTRTCCRVGCYAGTWCSRHCGTWSSLPGSPCVVSIKGQVQISEVKQADSAFIRSMKDSHSSTLGPDFPSNTMWVLKKFEYGETTN